ncbi:MAG: glycosyltransferase [Deltaproteobacteria bacterium]|nr:glycosyltransferase [Deltaproteobacteria bacterium]
MSGFSDWARLVGERPEVALITNHGYAGVEIPLGGAPDTGGQNFYVNQLAEALERLGYAVTIFARGGFPFFGSDRLREGMELLSARVRYVYVPGGGDTFIRKEDIAIALDEQVEWLDAFVRQEAARRSCKPWEVYEFVNTHYWDAAVMGIGLVDRWIGDVAARQVLDVLDGVVDEERGESLWQDRAWLAVGGCPAGAVGSILLESRGAGGRAADRAAEALASWARTRGVPVSDEAAPQLAARVDEAARRSAPALLPLRSALCLGEAVLEAWEADGRTVEEFQVVDRHVWTPHSLGELKSLNYRSKPDSVRRDLKFCERRNHEQVVCDWTRAFAATSGEIASYLVTHCGVDAESIFYFPPCVNRTLFRPYGDEERAGTYRYLSQVSGVPVEELVRARIVFETSRMDGTKRKDVLLEAFALVAAEEPDVYLFIGGGPENDVFKELSVFRDSLPSLEGRAFLTGFLPDEEMYPLFSIADVFVTPSEMEGFGMSASQAAAAGTALVSSDLVPFATLYVPDDALIVRAGDVKGFAEAIGRLLADDADRMRRAGRLAEATRELDWDVQTRRFIAHLIARGMSVAQSGSER